MSEVLINSLISLLYSKAYIKSMPTKAEDLKSSLETDCFFVRYIKWIAFVYSIYKPYI